MSSHHRTISVRCNTGVKQRMAWMQDQAHVIFPQRLVPLAGWARLRLGRQLTSSLASCTCARQRHSRHACTPQRHSWVTYRHVAAWSLMSRLEAQRVEHQLHEMGFATANASLQSGQDDTAPNTVFVLSIERQHYAEGES